MILCTVNPITCPTETSGGTPYIDRTQFVPRDSLATALDSHKLSPFQDLKMSKRMMGRFVFEITREIPSFPLPTPISLPPLITVPDSHFQPDLTYGSGH